MVCLTVATICKHKHAFRSDASPIVSPDNATKANLQKTLGGEFLAFLAGPGHGVNHIPDIVGFRQGVVQLSQILGGLGLASNLKELNANLPGFGVVRVEPLGGAHDHALDIVAGNAIGDNDDVEGLDGCFVAVRLALDRLRHLIEVGSEDMVESGSGWRTTERSHTLE